MKTSLELEPGPVGETTVMTTTRVLLCLAGCSQRSSIERKLRRLLRGSETQRSSQPNPRRMITMLDRMSKSKRAPLKKSVLRQGLRRRRVIKIHPLRVKEAMSTSVNKSTIEDLQRKDSTLKKCFERVGKLVFRENNVGDFFLKNAKLYRKHQETNTGRSFNQLVIPKEIRQQVMSVNHKSAFSRHLGAKKTKVRTLPFLARTTPGRH